MDDVENTTSNKSSDHKTSWASGVGQKTSQLSPKCQ